MELNITLSQLIEQYDGFIVDLWGVIHNGQFPHEGVVQTLEILKQKNKYVIFLSNAPRRKQVIEDRLTEIGIPSTHYDDIYSSGEATYQALISRQDKFFSDIGLKAYHLGPERDQSVYEKTGIEIVPIDQADFIINTGPTSFDHSVKDYIPELEDCARYNLPMICVNPDIIVRILDNNVICAGALAEYYETLGQKVHYYGKPHKPIYEACLAMMSDIPKDKILAIGDSLETDITGANNAAIDSAWIIKTGIHAKDFNDSFSTIKPDDFMIQCQRFKVKPNYILPSFSCSG